MKGDEPLWMDPQPVIERIRSEEVQRAQRRQIDHGGRIPESAAITGFGADSILTMRFIDERRVGWRALATLDGARAFQIDATPKGWGATRTIGRELAVLLV
jgi:hypothetical protein